MEHTKGPWYTEKLGAYPDEICITVGPPTGAFIATVPRYSIGSEEVAEADARLIAASPDLLDACKCVLADALAALQGEWDKSDGGFKAQVDMLQEAIAKAKGKE